MSTSNTMFNLPARDLLLHYRWYVLSRWRPSTASSFWVLILVALSLLWTFHQVARVSVLHGEQRLQITSQYNQATWKCNRFTDRIARQSCLDQRVAHAIEEPTSLL